MLYNILLIVQIVVSVAMIALILMQHGKGADAGAAFGSGASGTVFGSRGSGNFLSRTTAILATIFFVNCIALAWMVSNRTTNTATSIMDSVPASTIVPKIAPEVPAAPASSEVPAVPAQGAPASGSTELPKTEAAPAATATPAPAAQAEVPAASAAPAEPAKPAEAAPATPAASGEAATTEPKKP